MGSVRDPSARASVLAPCKVAEAMGADERAFERRTCGVGRGRAIASTRARHPPEPPRNFEPPERVASAGRRGPNGVASPTIENSTRLIECLRAFEELRQTLTTAG